MAWTGVRSHTMSLVVNSVNNVIGYMRGQLLVKLNDTSRAILLHGNGSLRKL